MFFYFGGPTKRVRGSTQTVPLEFGFSSQEALGVTTEGGSAPANFVVTISPIGNTPPNFANPQVSIASDVNSILNGTPVRSGSGPDYDFTIAFNGPGAKTAADYPAVLEFSDANVNGGTPVQFSVTLRVNASSGVRVVPLLTTRFRGPTATGRMKVWSPIEEGELLPTELNKVAVWDKVLNQEIPCYTEIPNNGAGVFMRPHFNGSVNQVLVQFDLSVAMALDAVDTTRYELRIGNVKSTSDLVKDPITATNYGPSTHPTWNVAQNQAVHELWKWGYFDLEGWPLNFSDRMVGKLTLPMKSKADDLALGGTAARYINDYVATRDNKWSFFDDAQQGNGTATVKETIMSECYYDRPFGIWMQFWKSGDREDYKQAKAYSWQWIYGVGLTSPGYLHPEGWAVALERMYTESCYYQGITSGDPNALNSCKWAAEMAYADYADLTESGFGSQLTVSQDQRTISNTLLTWLVAWRAGFDTVFKGGPRSVTGRLEEMYKMIYEGLDTLGDDPCYQTAPGNMQFMIDLANSNPCLGKPNFFMLGGLWGDQTVKLIYFYSPSDARVTVVPQRIVDMHHNTVWNLVGGGTGVAVVAGGGLNGNGDAIRYATCALEGGSNPAPDLTGLFLVTWGYVARTVGGTYITKLDALWDGGRTNVVSSLRGDGSKIFNQSMRASYTVSNDLGL